jgi:glyoxylase-like metal-dependent hydrolase (beta-lactamase superfamily II)
VKTRIDRVVSPGVQGAAGASAAGASAAEASAAAAGTNAWIVGDDEEVIVIDPAQDGAAVLDAVGDREVLAVICTHGHASHIAAAIEVADRDEAPIALHRADLLAWHEVHADVDPEIAMEDGGSFEVGDVRLEVLHTPGHSPGAVSVYCEDLDVVFTGDTLLKGRPGPHHGKYADFPGQLTSIGENLLTLPGDTRVLSGHGEETTVAAEEKRFDSWVAAGPAALAASP